jgi:hypothetical protein
MVLLTPSWLASSASGGSLSPGLYSPDRIAAVKCLETCWASPPFFLIAIRSPILVAFTLCTGSPVCLISEKLSSFIENRDLTL